MLDISTIRRMSREAAKKAASEGLEPYILWPGEEDDFPPFPFPFIGDYRPKGYRLCKKYFVDSSGLGAEDEPALTIDRFIKCLKPGRGYAVIEAGQFQVIVGEFKKLD